MTVPEPAETRDRWRAALEQRLARQERIAQLRRDLAAARRAGVAARHATKLRRSRAGDTTQQGETA